MIQSTNPMGAKLKPLQELFDFLNREHPLIYSTVCVAFSHRAEDFMFNGRYATGTIEVVGSNAIVSIAAKNRSLRSIALTVAHEYMHCIQFIQRDLYMNDQNREELESEAKTFAEDVLKRLWTEQQIFYPSNL